MSEDAFHDPCVALVLFADAFLLDQASQMHMALVLGRGGLMDIIVHALQGFREVALNAREPLVVPIDNGRARTAVEIQCSWEVSAFQGLHCIDERRAGVANEARQGFELFVVAVAPAVDGLFAVAHDHPHFIQ